MNGWDLGVSYFKEDIKGGSDSEAYAAGVNYETGLFTYGASYLYKETGDEQLDRYTVGVNYAYGPGMSLNGSVSYNAFDNKAVKDEDATIVAVGTVINF
jgi:predicted porin